MKNNTRKWRSIQAPVAILMAGFFCSSPAMAEDLEKLQGCGTCHTEQADDFSASVHYINRTGVQAGCNSCHQHQQHKDGANTSKQVSKSRMDMAMSEWKRMKENESQECRTCHSHMAMDLAKQEPRSVDRHEEAFDKGQTSCVDCHKGISHQLPTGWKAIAQKAGLQK